MIRIESIVKVVDNSGATQVKCLKILGKSSKSSADIGDLIVCVVRRLRKNKKFKKVNRREILYGLIVSINKDIKRNSGIILVNSQSSSVVLLNKNKNPLATRILEPVFKELKYKGYLRILSLCRNVI